MEHRQGETEHETYKKKKEEEETTCDELNAETKKRIDRALFKHDNVFPRSVRVPYARFIYVYVNVVIAAR